MIPFRLSLAVEKLLRAMPRNPDVIELGEALKEARAAAPSVAVTEVAATKCPRCTARREKQKSKMRNYRKAKKPVRGMAEPIDAAQD